MTLLLYALVGAGAGTVAGLFGIGGGLVIVPVLVFSFTLSGFDPAILTQLAIGTSLTTIVFTSLSSVWAHHRLGNVQWPVFGALAPGIAVGVWLGVNVAGRLSGAHLQLAFGVFVVGVALQMALALKPRPQRHLPGRLGTGVAGGVIGSVSALFGIGGGTLTVPFLTWCNVRILAAVATAAACGLPIAVIGMLTNLYVGWQRPGLPEGSTGFVYWPAVAGVVVTSTFFARLGARWAQRLPADQLRRAFALLMVLVGAQLIWRNL